jgi:hypothetical protein
MINPIAVPVLQQCFGKFNYSIVSDLLQHIKDDIPELLLHPNAHHCLKTTLSGFNSDILLLIIEQIDSAFERLMKVEHFWHFAPLLATVHREVQPDVARLITSFTTELLTSEKTARFISEFLKHSTGETRNKVAASVLMNLPRGSLSPSNKALLLTIFKSTQIEEPIRFQARKIAERGAFNPK